MNNVAVINGNTVTVIDRNNPLITNNTNLNNVAFFVPGEDNWHSRGGWNAGGGVSMLWGHSELFLEARVLGFKPNIRNLAQWSRPVRAGFFGTALVLALQAPVGSALALVTGAGS